MSGRTLTVIVVAAVLALLASVWVSSSRSPSRERVQPGPLAEGLSGQLDDVNGVRITVAGDVVLATMERDAEGHWGLKEKGGYPVDMAALRQLISNIATARRIEAKTALPERYGSLGVDDVTGPDARGARVDIQAPGQVYSYIIGDNPPRGGGTYVRRADEAQSWLIGTAIAVERNPARWVAREIVDIPADQLVGIEITPEEGPAIALKRDDQNGELGFSLTSLPDGREPAEDYQREAIAGLLSGLRFEDVFRTDERPEAEHPRKARFLLRDGRRVDITSWQDGGQTYARFAMQLDEEAAREWLAAAGNPETKRDEEARDMDAALDDLRKTARVFHDQRAEWVYQLPSFKAANLNKGLEDYLKPKE